MYAKNKVINETMTNEYESYEQFKALNPDFVEFINDPNPREWYCDVVIDGHHYIRFQNKAYARERGWENLEY